MWDFSRELSLWAAFFLTITKETAIVFKKIKIRSRS
jgi:hypothetical protein